MHGITARRTRGSTIEEGCTSEQESGQQGFALDHYGCNTWLIMNSFQTSLRVIGAVLKAVGRGHAVALGPGILPS